jgi:hypothetical protein
MRERGSTLLLFPAVLLVVVVLASITVDLARVRLVHRQADDPASAAANDAVTAGLDVGALRAGEDYRLDPVVVHDVVDRAIGAHRHAGAGRLEVDLDVTGPRAVRVDVTGHVPLGFARAVPGAPAVVEVRARATAVAALR